MHGHLELAGGVPQPPQKCTIVFVVMKNHLTIIASLNHMMRLMRHHKTGKTGHGSKYAR